MALLLDIGAFNSMSKCTCVPEQTTYIQSWMVFVQQKNPKRNEESDPKLSKVTLKICLGNYRHA